MPGPCRTRDYRAVDSLVPLSLLSSVDISQFPPTCIPICHHFLTISSHISNHFARSLLHTSTSLVYTDSHFRYRNRGQGQYTGPARQRTPRTRISPDNIRSAKMRLLQITSFAGLLASAQAAKHWGTGTAGGPTGGASPTSTAWTTVVVPTFTTYCPVCLSVQDASLDRS